MAIHRPNILPRPCRCCVYGVFKPNYLLRVQIKVSSNNVRAPVTVYVFCFHVGTK